MRNFRQDIFKLLLSLLNDDPDSTFVLGLSFGLFVAAVLLSLSKLVH